MQQWQYHLAGLSSGFIAWYPISCLKKTEAFLFPKMEPRFYLGGDVSRVRGELWLVEAMPLPPTPVLGEPLLQFYLIRCKWKLRHLGEQSLWVPPFSLLELWTWCWKLQQSFCNYEATRLKTKSQKVTVRLKASNYLFSYLFKPKRVGFSVTLSWKASVIICLVIASGVDFESSFAFIPHVI